MGVTNYDDNVLLLLSNIAHDEENLLRQSSAQYALHLGRKMIDMDCIRLASDTRQFIQGPIRQHNLEASRIHNARTIAWPLGNQVRIPITDAANYRINTLLEENNDSTTGSSNSSSNAPTVTTGPLPGVPPILSSTGYAVDTGSLGNNPKITIPLSRSTLTNPPNSSVSSSSSAATNAMFIDE